jgi:hypothetical protein
VRPTTANYLPIVDVPFPTPTDTPSPTATPLPENTPTNTSVPPTATPTDTPYPPTEPPIPPPAAPCNLNAPAPAEGAQAWMTVTDPPRFSMTTLCVRLILNGQVIPGATVSGVAHYKTTNTNLGPATSGADGVGHITFSIGGAAAGYTVVVDAKAVFGGQTYTAQTSFTPQ